MLKLCKAKKKTKAMLFQVITKPACSKCDVLIKWLNDNDIKFEEWSIADEMIQQRLKRDYNFTERFCDIQGCMLYIPLIRLDETGVYFFKELFDQDGLRVDSVKRLLKITT